MASNVVQKLRSERSSEKIIFSFNPSDPMQLAYCPNASEALCGRRRRFSEAVTAAIMKKKVPITIVTDRDRADLILKAAPVDSKEESGAGKLARCLFAYCIGIEGWSEVSVVLSGAKESNVLWA